MALPDNQPAIEIDDETATAPSQIAGRQEPAIAAWSAPVFAWDRNDRSQLVGMIGAGLLFLGTFVPIWSLPFASSAVGSFSYVAFREGNAVFFAAIASFAIVLTKWHRPGLWITTLCSVATVTFSAIHVVRLTSVMRGFYERILGDVSDQLPASFVSLGFGFPVLFVGITVMAVSAVMKDLSDKRGRKGLVWKLAAIPLIVVVSGAISWASFRSPLSITLGSELFGGKGDGS